MLFKSQKSSSRNLKLVLEYDGLRYFGFQRQKEKPTLQAALEEALSKLFNRPTKIAAAAGRTDSGVHAKAQVVNFRTNSTLPAKKIQSGLNALLPKDVVVKGTEEVSTDFHARYDAQWKTYEYLVFNSALRSPLLNGRSYQYPFALDLTQMKKAAHCLLGRHDFKAFQASGSSAKSSVRRIRRLTLSRKGNLIRFVIEADGFLYHMVRRIIGTFLEVGRGHLALLDFKKALEKCDRTLTGPTAPSCGLTLVSVCYRKR